MRSDNDLITSFHAHLLTEKRISENTFLAYRQDIEQLLTFLHERKETLSTCTKTHLKSLLKKLKRSGAKPRTLSRKISAVKLFFAYLHQHYAIANRADGLVFPKIEKSLPIYLTENEIERLFKVAKRDESPRGRRNKVILSLLYATGMRISELLGLTIDQVQFDTGFIQVMGKGNKERAVPVPHGMLKMLRNYVDVTKKQLLPASIPLSNNHLFISFYQGKDRPMTRQAYWIILKKLLVKANITKKVSPHTLRHSLATHMLRNGANLRSLQLLLGHEQLSTLQVYTHLETTQIRDVYDKKHPRA